MIKFQKQFLQGEYINNPDDVIHHEIKSVCVNQGFDENNKSPEIINQNKMKKVLKTDFIMETTEDQNIKRLRLKLVGRFKKYKLKIRILDSHLLYFSNKRTIPLEKLYFAEFLYGWYDLPSLKTSEIVKILPR